MAQSSLAKRVAVLEADMQVMKMKLDHAQAVAGIERGIRAMNRNDGVPARAALEALRQKQKIRGK